ncbi:MAG: site-specific DNA-methyltransferase [Spirochaetota bacterium]
MKETTLNGKTPDIAEENIKKLRQIFPDVFTEDKVDFEKLQQVLGNYVEDNNERYNFTWNGKGRALRLSQTPSLGTLRPCKEESKNWDTTQNLYIEGDNLEVLKLLQKSYHSKIKMIYIDPPYNTGGDFVYPDNFHDSLENYKKITRQIDGDGNRISTNTEASGRYHTDWLNMMYPRLRLARNLLRDDGIIFISINDKEIENLKKICGEIFGEDNEIATLIWDKNHSAQAGIYKVYHEYVLVYCKNINLIPRPKSLTNELFEAGAMKKISGRHPATKFTFPAGTRFDAPNGTDLGQEYGDAEKVRVIKGRMLAKNNKLCENVTLEAGFTQANQMYNFFYGNRDSLVDSQGQKIVEFYFNSTGKIKIIKERSVETPQTTCKFGTQGMASNALSSLFELEESPFSSPKPVGMLVDFIQRFTSNNDIVLDFFSGSATTAEAVMKVNSIDKKRKLKFILIQLPELLEESLKHAQKDAIRTLQVAIQYLKTNKLKQTIAEIGKERIRRAGEKIKEENKDKENIENLDTGFKVLKLDTSNIRKWQPDHDNLEKSLLDYKDNYAEDRTELDLIYEIMLKYGLDLTYPLDEFTIANKKVYSIGFGMLMICLDNEITIEVAKGILEKVKELKPESTRVLFKDNGFKTDSNKANIKEILKSGGIEEFITL